MHKIYEFDNVTSTFDKINEFEHEHLLTVIAKRQTNGCGRLGRSWQSDDGGLYFSTLMDASYFKDNMGFSTVVCAVAVARVVGLFGKVYIKWPNDIVMNGKKICGILTKMTSSKGETNYICAGIGINTNITKFDTQLVNASSIYIETNKICNNTDIAKSVLDEIEKIIKTDSSKIIKEYKELCITLGKEITVHHITDGEYKGICKDINDDGTLVVESQGKTHIVNSGEVSVRGLYGYV
jgi:BirA family biotin operon repressor/biotin-[acetyl-CoA-carboxylase] ligase